VESNLVCMVNNQFMGTEQIPVTVDGRTYFGCCPMCKGKLESDAAIRSATDPITGNRVDKSVAVIGRAASGSVFYFENEKNLQIYASR
jgi:YHS domain-containing protein